MTDARSADGAEILQRLRALAAERILVLDGAMGTEIQALRLTEEDFRGERFRELRATTSRATTTCSS